MGRDAVEVANTRGRGPGMYIYIVQVVGESGRSSISHFPEENAAPKARSIVQRPFLKENWQDFY